MQNTQIISVINQKGGVGKTTSSINIASYLAASEIPTLIIDMDPQSNATSGVGVEIENNQQSIYDVIIKEVQIKDAILNTKLEYLDIVPSSSQLVGAEIELVSEISREYRLKEALNSKNNEVVELKSDVKELRRMLLEEILPALKGLRLKTD